MRTDTPSNSAPTVARIRAEIGRARRRFASRAPASQWSIGAAVLAAVVALVYATTGPSASTGGYYVRSGEEFSSDDLLTIERALVAKHIPSVTRQGRVEVAIDRLDDANDVVAKLDVGRHPLSEIESRAAESNPLESMWDREQRREQAGNEKLRAMIRRIDGIADAYVTINRVKPRGFGRQTPTATAFVYLETKGDREVSSDTVQSIQTLIAGAEPSVKPDAVTVTDTTARTYVNARNPSLGLENKNRARSEELRHEIVKELDWIREAKVSVRLVPTLVAVAPPLPASRPEPAPAPAAESFNQPPLSMRVNEPLELTPDGPTPEPVAAAPALPPPPEPVPAAETLGPHKAKVWVKVPRSYYLKAVNRRDPSLDDLQPLIDKVRSLIERAVKQVVPPHEFEDVQVDTTPDEIPAADAPSPPSTSTELRWPLSWWVPVGVACGATAALVAVGFGLIAARRPLSGPASRPNAGLGRYKIDKASEAGPGPSERVRELIRLNPEAAASVLHRWTGQGGTAE